MLSIEAGHLVIRRVPFVGRDRRIGYGTLISPLDLAGDRTVPPRNHVAYFGGGTPCDLTGTPLPMVHDRAVQRHGGGLVSEHMLSSQPKTGEYVDYHAKMTTYVAEIESHAKALDPSIGARLAGQATDVKSQFSPFRYVDTASARAGIGAFTDKLMRHSIGIVGLGGSGSYILDLVAKTPVGRIHLWDPDVFEQHSAFRSPGAPSVEELSRRPAKVDYLAALYSRMHKGVIPHRRRMGSDNLSALRNLDFVFLAVDSAESRGPIVEFLQREGRSFIDIGMGLDVSDGGIVGSLRVTTSTAAMHDHVRERGRIPMADAAGQDPYATNIQVADLNCLNAALAVIRWKRHLGFYADFEQEHWSAYSVDGNALFNEERPAGRVP
jgi:hypothetical protein